MSAGKAASQACHASLMAFLNTAQKYPEKIEVWLDNGQGKIIVAVNTENELLDIYRLLTADVKGKDLCFLVRDRGLTELNEMEYTALAIGPFDDDFINSFTGHLRLYK